VVWNVSVREEEIGSFVFVPACISIERDVSSPISQFDRGIPVECRIEEQGADPGLPFQPGMGKWIAGPAFPDHKTEVGGSIKQHAIVKHQRLAFAVRSSGGFHLIRGQP